MNKDIEINTFSTNYEQNEIFHKNSFLIINKYAVV